MAKQAKHEDRLGSFKVKLLCLHVTLKSLQPACRVTLLNIYHLKKEKPPTDAQTGPSEMHPVRLL